MKKLLLSFFLLYAVLSAYNVTRSRKLAYACAATFGTEAEINSWTCKYCGEYNLTNVNNT